MNKNGMYSKYGRNVIKKMFIQIIILRASHLGVHLVM